MKKINSLVGKIEVQIFDKENNLKKIVSGKNTLTTKGIKRICEILTQGARNGISITESIDGNTKLNTLPNGQNSIGINMIEWKDKEYTTFEFSENILGLNQYHNLFNESTNGDYAFMTKNDEVVDKFDDFYFPNKDNKNDRNTSGWISDLGIKHHYNKEYIFSSNPCYVTETNVKYNSLTIKSADGKKLIEDVDYSVSSWGDYENYLKINVAEKFLNTQLYLTYSYYNVPKCPIVGFSFDSICDNTGTNLAQNFISGWSWSLNQGKSRLSHFFPNLSGCPSGNSLSSMYEIYKLSEYSSTQTNFYSDKSHQAIWYNPFGQSEKRFFIHSYPYAVINPTQLVWYSHLYNNSKCYFKNFSLLGIDLPKLGPQAIKLGTGTGKVSTSDEDLFSPLENSKTSISHKRNNGVDSVVFEIKLDFDDCNSNEEITEIGLFFPENEDVFYSDSDYWNNSVENGGSGRNNEDISGKNRIVKFDKINKDKCNTMFSHGLFEEAWKKSKDEKITILYTVKINW